MELITLNFLSITFFVLYLNVISSICEINQASAVAPSVTINGN